MGEGEKYGFDFSHQNPGQILASGEYDVQLASLQSSAIFNVQFQYVYD